MQPGGQRTDECERSAVLHLLSLLLLLEIPFSCLFLPPSLSSPLRCETLLSFGKALFLSWSKVTHVLITFVLEG